MVETLSMVSNTDKANSLERGSMSRVHTSMVRYKSDFDLIISCLEALPELWRDFPLCT